MGEVVCVQIIFIIEKIYVEMRYKNGVLIENISTFQKLIIRI